MLQSNIFTPNLYTDREMSYGSTIFQRELKKKIQKPTTSYYIPSIMDVASFLFHLFYGYPIINRQIKENLFRTGY